jgi:hypothetical protein
MKRYSLTKSELEFCLKILDNTNCAEKFLNNGSNREKELTKLLMFNEEFQFEINKY